MLHELGVVHRDVKPQNLLLRSGGSAGERLLVADLGVAKAMLHASGLTQVVGTPAYMAPEQVTGDGIDTRADVHALAAVAYQLLTGSLARTGSVTDLLQAGLPVAPSRLVDLPPGVDDVLLRSLDPDPDRRHDDVGSLRRGPGRGAAPDGRPDPPAEHPARGPADRRHGPGRDAGTPRAAGPAGAGLPARPGRGVRGVVRPRRPAALGLAPPAWAARAA